MHIQIGLLEILAYSFQLVKKMKKIRNDLSGSTFGELTVIKMADSLGAHDTIGRYNLFEDAVNARKLAESELFGEYAFNDNIDHCPLERIEEE